MLCFLNYKTKNRLKASWRFYLNGKLVPSYIQNKSTKQVKFYLTNINLILNLLRTSNKSPGFLYEVNRNCKESNITFHFKEYNTSGEKRAIGRSEKISLDNPSAKKLVIKRFPIRKKSPKHLIPLKNPTPAVLPH